MPSVSRSASKKSASRSASEKSKSRSKSRSKTRSKSRSPSRRSASKSPSKKTASPSYNKFLKQFAESVRRWAGKPSYDLKERLEHDKAQAEELRKLRANYDKMPHLKDILKIRDQDEPNRFRTVEEEKLDTFLREIRFANNKNRLALYQGDYKCVGQICPIGYNEIETSDAIRLEENGHSYCFDINNLKIWFVNGPLGQRYNNPLTNLPWSDYNRNKIAQRIFHPFRVDDDKIFMAPKLHQRPNYTLYNNFKKWNEGTQLNPHKQHRRVLHELKTKLAKQPQFID